MRILFTMLLLAPLAGCSIPRGPNGEPPPTPIRFANPAFVQAANHDVVWDQLVDVVDDYFRIEREERVRLVGNVLTEGRIDTFPETGSTILEPHKGDSVGRYNQVEATLQTIRRIGQFRVIPTDGGYLVEVVVWKELEDRARPDRTTAGAATFRQESAPQGLRDQVIRDSADRGWISQGRDPPLEQEILGKLCARLGMPGMQQGVPLQIPQ